jgi:PDZ domain-containing protein
MSQRRLAGLVAVPLLLALWVAALWLPLPYVTYSPGITVDVLGQQDSDTGGDGQEIIQVTGHKTYRDDGELRMTTVYVTQPEARVNLFEVMRAWLSDEDAVYPYDSVYAPDETAEDADLESAVQMASSQDLAVAAALRELGVDVTPVVKILNVGKNTPADGAFKVGDELLSIDGEEVSDPARVGEIVRADTDGTKLAFGIRRDGKEMTVRVAPKVDDEGVPRIGIVPGNGFDFPFQVYVNINPDIGGPSAGLMFSLAIYDTLTPDSLTGDEVVAGTGEIREDGSVGPIGGIQQKIAAAREDGAALFLVPPDNCEDTEGAVNGDMRLVRADTMHDAVESIETWVADPDASLPSCSTSGEAAGE